MSFAPALKRGLSIAVGVHGLGTVGIAGGAPQPGRAGAASWRIDAKWRSSLALAPAGEPAPAQPGPDAQNQIVDRIGAGFLVSGAEGLIVTAAHVVVGAQLVLVRLPDQRLVRATLVGDDAAADIALLRVPLQLPEPPPPGRSGALRPGDWVLAVGEPYGLGRSVAAGVVGGIDRHFPEDREMLFIQSDLALNPGNSGGPLLDSGGALIGMNSRSIVGLFGTTGISLSIPIEIVLQIVDELRTEGRVARPRLGAIFDDITPAVAVLVQRPDASGALVVTVGSDTPAERLGLQVGDIIVGMNGQAIAGSGDLVRALLAWRSERGTRMTVHRLSDVVELQLP